MSGFIFTIVAIGFFGGLIGAGVRLPIFANRRRVGLAVCLLSLVLGVPLAKAVRTPTQVAEDERINQLVEDGEEQERASEEALEADEGYSDAVVLSSAKQAVKRKLLDDRAARFREVSVVVQPNGSKAVCGEVNSKNRVGGYAGYQHFISAGTAEHTWLEEQVPDFASAWNQVCTK